MAENRDALKLGPDQIDSFVYELTEFLNPLLPPEKNMGNFFDTNENYIPLNDFVQNWFEKYRTRDRNYN